jgi:replicative DNA helicase
METPLILPQSLESERALLGALLLNSELVFVVSELVSAEDFVRDAHARLYRLILEVVEKGERCDPVTVQARILGSPRPEDFGGIAYVSTLPELVPSVENIEHYARIVREMAIRRKLQAVSQQMAELAATGPDLAEVLDQAERSVFEVADGRARRDWYAMGPIIDKEIDRIQSLADRKGAITGVTTGYADLDKLLAGFQRGELIILAARPSMGKTALALNFARNAAMMGGVGVGIFSLEMPRGQVVARMLCAEGKVDASRVRTGYLTKEDWPRLTDAAERLYKCSVSIDDSAALTVTQMRSKARRLKAENASLGLLVVDYLQLMQGAGGPRESREQAISSISRGLKALAKELDLPVIALSQLNRSVEARENKRPLLSDLRESGAIEQDADVIMFIYREEYYKKDREDYDPSRAQVSEVIVAKQRNGPIDTARLWFRGQFQVFENYDPRADAGDYV